MSTLEILTTIYTTTLSTMDTTSPSTVEVLATEPTTITAALTSDTTSASGAIYPAGMLGFTAACAFIISVFGTCGNFITIAALAMSKKLRKRSTTLFVINLAVIEMFFCIFILPMSGAQYTYLQYTETPLLSDNACVFFTVTRYTLTQAQIQTLIAIAVTRAIAVTWPRLFLKVDNPTVTGCYICFIWIYSLSFRIPTALKVFGRYVFNDKTMECDLGPDIPSLKARGILMFTDAVIPVLVVIILYIYIFIRVKVSSIRVARATKIHRPSLSDKGTLSNSSTSGERKLSNPSIQGLRHMMRRESIKAAFSRKESTVSQTKSPTSRRDMKVARSIFVIFLIVLISSIPVTIVHIINKPSYMPKIFLGVHILYWIQYSLNMVVYVLMNRQYRDAFVTLLARVLPSLESHHGFRFPWENQSETSKSQTNNAFNSLKRSKNSSKNTKVNDSQEASALLKQNSPSQVSGKMYEPAFKQLESIVDNQDKDDLAQSSNVNMENEIVYPLVHKEQD